LLNRQRYSCRLRVHHSSVWAPINRVWSTAMFSITCRCWLTMMTLINNYQQNQSKSMFIHSDPPWSMMIGCDDNDRLINYWLTMINRSVLSCQAGLLWIDQTKSFYNYKNYRSTIRSCIWSSIHCMQCTVHFVYLSKCTISPKPTSVLAFNSISLLDSLKNIIKKLI
jgi:hypothetical protein